MISDVDIFKQAYADGYNDGWLQGTQRAESREELGLSLVVTAEDDAWIDGMRKQGLTIDD